MDHTKDIRVLSICSGMLGIERGIELAGFRTRAIAYVEREAFCCFNLAKQMETGLVDSAPIWTDLKTFNPHPFRNRVHGIVGGYPCQGESAAGLRKLEKDERYLWPRIREIIIGINPLFCFFENVDGHISGTFKYVLRDLRSMGYKVEAGIYSAAEVGAPHQRKRIFILACADVEEFRRCMADANREHGDFSNQSERNEAVTITQGGDILVDTMRTRLQDRNERGTFISENETSERCGFSRADTAIGVLADTDSQRRRKGGSVNETGQFNSKSQKWPVRPGQTQEEWEAKRTIKSSMGCTVDGYNFRTDLLRMYGNGVVQQTAAKAFTELLELITTHKRPIL